MIRIGSETHDVVSVLRTVEDDGAKLIFDGNEYTNVFVKAGGLILARDDGTLEFDVNVADYKNVEVSWLINDEFQIVGTLEDAAGGPED